MRFLLHSMLLGAVVGCASGGRMPGSRVPDAPSHRLTSAAIHQRVALAKLALDSAARTEDVRLFSELVDGTTLVTDGETLHGTTEIISHLRQLAGGRSIERLQLVPERVVYCTNGVLERNGDLMIATVGETGPDTLFLPFSMHWRLTETEVRVDRISVGAQAVRRTPTEPCPSLVLAESSRRRAVFWVLPPGGSVTRYNAADDLQNALEAEGFSPKAIAFGSSAAVTPGRRSASKVIGATAGARVRVVNQLSAEVSTSLIAPIGRVHAFNGERRLHVMMDHRPTFVAAGLSYDWRRFRLGGGPVMVTNNWDLLERELFHYPGAGWQVQRVHTDSTWTTRHSAFALEGGYWMPLSRRVRLELVGQYRSGKKETIPMLYIEPIDVSLTGYSMGLSFGLMY